MSVTINVYSCCHLPGRMILALGIPQDASVRKDVNDANVQTITGDPDVIQAILTEQTTTVHIKGFRDHRGKPATVDGPPKWSTDNSDLVALEPSPDGMSCKITTGPMPGIARVQALADADLGEGKSMLFGTVELVIALPQATEIDLAVDLPVDA